jgi:hypothetical protein
MTQAAYEPADRHSTVAYIATMSSELAQLARSFKLEALAYVLDMARLEAENMGQSKQPRRSA